MFRHVLANFQMSVSVLLICLFLLWLVSLKAKDASLIDIFWGAGFGIVALVCLCLAPVKTPYIILLAALPLIWAVRLSLYLAKRNLGHGEDKRYVAMRKRAEKKGLSEMAWRRRAFFSIFLGQGLLIMIVSAPIWVGMGASVLPPSDVYEVMALSGEGSLISATQIGLLAAIGAIIWLVGFLFETIGDAQLSAFMKKMKDYDGAYEDKPVLDTGLWKYTRHPNYFGNACMWWGIWLVACQAPWGWLTIISPIIMTLLLTRVSGRDLLERQLKKRPAYQDYIARTPGFFPWFPKKG